MKTYSIIQMIFIGEVIAVMWLFLSGNISVFEHVATLRQENITVADKIKCLEDYICHLNYEINEWQSNPLVKEKYAREHLQMAYPNDIVFLMPKTGERGEI